MKKHIYLDWNVIQHTKHKNPKFKGDEFAQFIEKAKKKYIFPASTIHLMDLSQGGTTKKHLEYVPEDLKYLSELSDNFFIELDCNQEVKLSKKFIGKEFEEVSKYEEPTPTLQTLEFSYKVDINKMDKNDMFLDLIKKNNNVFDHTVANEFTKNLKKITTEPTEYKKFREQTKIALKYIKKNETYFHENRLYLEKIQSFFEIIDINESEKLKKEYKKILSSFLSFQNKNFEMIRTLDLIKASYLLLDFSPIFSEKIDKKNKPTNMQRDAFNLMLASKAEYYVTEDDNNYEKANFIADVLNLDVKIKKMDEIRNSFNFI
ncbi:hypothetical protein [Terasakiella pusilla]|uniref:hypothetical protein n=1 Tax=Terasakiella pusilla TaxID=64973 RepID=UPI003AA804E8